MAADGEHDVAARAPELGRDLLTARAGADDEHTPAGSRLGLR